MFMQVRHFTASGIVLDGGSVLLIEHARLCWWMPPGGPIEPNEDPVQAVLREAAAQPRGRR
jgi:ADP-ribose pyrophosphatase YjhB (NUDIX family)